MTPFLRRVVETREREQDLADLEVYRESYGALGYTFQVAPFPVLRTAGALRVQGPEPRGVPTAPYKPRYICECGRPATVKGPQNSALVCQRCADLGTGWTREAPEPAAQLSDYEVWAHIRDWCASRWENFGHGFNTSGRAAGSP